MSASPENRENDWLVIRTDAKRAEAVLLVLSGASLEDVGRRFGVSRECVRLWLKHLGVVPNMRQRFGKPTSQRQRRIFRGLGRRRRRKERLRERFRQAAMWIRQCAVTPTVRDVAEFLGLPHRTDGLATNSLLGFLGRQLKERRAMRRIRLLYAMAGRSMRPKGTLGHRDGRDGMARIKRAEWARRSPEERASYARKIWASRHANALRKEFRERLAREP